MPQPLWSEEEDDFIRKLWADSSIPSMEIGSRMSPPRTKNAVIGRARRLRLPPRKISGGRPFKNGMFPQDSKKRKPPITSRFVSGLFFMKEHDPNQLALPIELPLAPQNWTPIGVPLLEAESHHCRAVIASSADSRGLALFCGHPIDRSQTLSFCEYHLSRYTQPKRQQ